MGSRSTMQKIVFISFILICLSSYALIEGKEDSTTAAPKQKKPKKCEKPKIFAYELDYDWVMGQSKWYFPIMSSQDLLRQSSDILQESLEELSSSGKRIDELKTKACFQAVWEGLNPIITGFGGKKASYELTPLDWTNFNILGYEKSWKNGQPGTLYITHTDNENFVVLLRCWEDGERTFSVMSVTKYPPKLVRRQIMDHLKLLGFREDEAHILDYDECASSKKTEL